GRHQAGAATVGATPPQGGGNRPARLRMALSLPPVPSGSPHRQGTHWWAYPERGLQPRRQTPGLNKQDGREGGATAEVKVWDAQTAKNSSRCPAVAETPLSAAWPSVRTANAWPALVLGTERPKCGMRKPAKNSSPSQTVPAGWSSVRTANAWPARLEMKRR